MKKGFKMYMAIWAILLAVFNVACFATPSKAAGLTKFGGAFWAGYIFITLAFIGQLICAFIAFKAENAKKLFYNLPIITISYTGLILTIIFGAVCMAVPNLPNWVGIIVCLAILAFTAIAVIKASAAAEIVANVDEKVSTQTSFIKNLTTDVQALVSRAKSEPVKAECKKVYEAARYSDPMSDDSLSVIEAEITVKMGELAAAIGTDDAEKAKEIADEIVILVGDRNKKCKAMKG